MANQMTPEETALIENLIYLFQQWEHDYHKMEDPAERGVTRCLNHLTSYRRLSELLAMNPGQPDPWDSDDESEAA